MGEEGIPTSYPSYVLVCWGYSPLKPHTSTIMSILTAIKNNFTPAGVRETRQTLSEFIKENNLDVAVLDAKAGKRRSLRLFDAAGTVGYLTASSAVSELIDSNCSVRKLMACEIGTTEDGVPFLMMPATASVARGEKIISKMNFDQLVG